MTYSCKGHKDRNRHKNRIKSSGQARLVYVCDINHNIPTMLWWAREDERVRGGRREGDRQPGRDKERHTRFPPFSRVPTGSPSRGGDITVYVWHKPTELAHCFLFCSWARFCLYGPFKGISFHKFSRQLFALSLCSSSLMSALLVLSTICLFMKVSLIPDMILCGWLGLKHELTNHKTDLCNVHNTLIFVVGAVGGRVGGMPDAQRFVVSR